MCTLFLIISSDSVVGLFANRNNEIPGIVDFICGIAEIITECRNLKHLCVSFVIFFDSLLGETFLIFPAGTLINNDSL